MSQPNQSEQFVAQPHTTPSRHAERASYARAEAYRVLDEALVCHVGFISDGRPVVLPTLHVRIDDQLFLHGSVAASLMRQARSGGVDVCVTVTLTDALVLAARQFSHSINYRSVVVHGRAAEVSDEAAKRMAMTALVEHVVAGRTQDSQPPTRKELAATAVLALDLEDVSLKARTGPPADAESAAENAHWQGLLPLRVQAGAPQRHAGPSSPPDYLRRLAPG